MEDSSPVSKQPPKPGRLLRFSLRAMLLFTAIIAVWFGSLANRAQKQRAAVAAIQEAGGHVFYDQTKVYVKEKTISLEAGTPRNSPLHRFIGEDYFRNVEVVSLEKPVTDDLLEHLQSLLSLNTVLLLGKAQESVAEVEAALPNVEVYP